jgi:nitrogen regulatory protein P-II 1
MELLVCVVNRDEKLEEILSGFLKLGVTGATVFHTEGMGRVLSQDVPVFAGLQTLMSRSRPRNTTILSVIESREVLQAAIAMVQEVCGDFDAPSTGIMFTVPVNRVVGLAPELSPDAE